MLSRANKPVEIDTNTLFLNCILDFGTISKGRNAMIGSIPDTTALLDPCPTHRIRPDHKVPWVDHEQRLRRPFGQSVVSCWPNGCREVNFR